MKKIVLAFIISLTISCSNNETDASESIDQVTNLEITQHCISANLQNNLIAFYPFNNGSLDDVHNANNLTNSTSAQPTEDRNGNPNCAYNFDFNNDEFLTTTDTNFLNNLSEYSISVWFKMETVVYGNYKILVGRDEPQVFTPCDANGQWALGLYDSSYPVFSVMGSSSTWDLYDHSGNETIDFSEWHHLLATYNVVNDELKMYRDGVLRAVSSGPCSINNTPSYEDIGDLLIGKNFHGQIDDVAIFNTTLDATAAAELYSMQPCCL